MTALIFSRTIQVRLHGIGKKWSAKSWIIWKIVVVCLLAEVQKSEFIVSLLVCERLFSLTLTLSIKLQENHAIRHQQFTNLVRKQTTCSNYQIESTEAQFRSASYKSCCFRICQTNFSNPIKLTDTSPWTCCNWKSRLLTSSWSKLKWSSLRIRCECWV